MPHSPSAHPENPASLGRAAPPQHIVGSAETPAPHQASRAHAAIQPYRAHKPAQGHPADEEASLAWPPSWQRHALLLLRSAGECHRRHARLPARPAFLHLPATDSEVRPRQERSRPSCAALGTFPWRPAAKAVSQTRRLKLEGGSTAAPTDSSLLASALSEPPGAVGSSTHSGSTSRSAPARASGTRSSLASFCLRHHCFRLGLPSVSHGHHGRWRRLPLVAEGRLGARCAASR